MNGFANTFLTLILGWLRVLIANLWKIVSSPDGDSLYRYIGDHWKVLLLILCAGGLVVDRVIYFARWRPDYVWASRRERRRERRQRAAQAPRAGREEAAKPAAAAETAAAAGAYAPPVSASAMGYYAPPAQTFAPRAAQAAPPARADAFAPAYAPARPAVSHTASPRVPAPAVPEADTKRVSSSFLDGLIGATARYAPIAQAAPRGARPAQEAAWQPPENLDPVFDDELPAWEESDAFVHTTVARNPAQGMVNSFGNAMPEPTEYLRDMRAGFAPQLPPQRIYQPAQTAKGPIHPGLQAEAFRQSIGLTQDGAPDRPPEADMQPPQPFTPYGRTLGEDAPRKRSRANPLATIAKKARDFVGVEDEDHKLTIHDLQPTVDMRSAFHEPVYPKAKKEQGGEG